MRKALNANGGQTKGCGFIGESRGEEAAVVLNIASLTGDGHTLTVACPLLRVQP